MIKSNKKFGIVLYTILSICAFAAVLIIPSSREVFKSLSAEHPYLMGFAKFALLATAGELIAVRMAKGEWALPALIIPRFVIWGFIGIWITFMMGVYRTAVMNGVLPVFGNDFVERLLRAFYISVIMNTTFGPTFMAVHKCSDSYLELRASGIKSPKLAQVMGSVDWTKFVSFTLFKTVPLFWIPAHTVTFLLPQEYQVMMAASLSVALGIILNLGKRAKK